MIKHGGNLREASRLYNIPLENWIDLSTGINPQGWCPPEIPHSVWQCLPEADDDLLAIAQEYYHCDDLLPIAGSQVAIQALPYCRQPSRIGIVSPCYAEHAYWWERAGHYVIYLASDEIDQFVDDLDVLLLINPNNPDGTQYAVDKLLDWHQQLSKNNGWLIVDEAFMDSTPEQSLLFSCKTIPEGLIVLRSIGKFFGLAGIRLGFIAAQPKLLQQIEQRQGPWAVSHPARWLGSLALRDQQWQQQACQFLDQQSEKLYQILSIFFENIKKNNYFCYFQHPQAEQIQQRLAKQGIWVRFFDKSSALRLGLPVNEAELQKLMYIFSKFFIRLTKKPINKS